MVNPVWQVLEAQAARLTDKDFLWFSSEPVSYSRFVATAGDYAARFEGIGIGQGHIVPSFFPNGLHAVATWFGLLRLGAIWAPINTEFRGKQLSRALNLTGARTIIVDAPYLEEILRVLPGLETVSQVVVHGAALPEPSGGVTFLRLEDLPGLPGVPAAPVLRGDVAMIQFTSGSTGASKAVQLSHGYLLGQAELTSGYFDIRQEDVIYCPFPLYHWDATVGTVMGALVRGATAALGDRFSVSRFWDDIRKSGATMFDFMGATLTFLYERPPEPSDKDHNVRLAWGLPMPPFRQAFEERFGFGLLEGYGSTEGGVCIFQKVGETYPEGSCGRLAPEYAMKLLDDDGIEVPLGETGEIVTRPHEPTLMMNGYLNMPEVNAELIRDGWYHTGDLGRVDARGNVYFMGRKKDIIRRRGENISALEVERVLVEHPDVVEAAAFGVPSPLTEEDVAVAVVLKRGTTLPERELQEHCVTRMARYMVPVYIYYLEELPKTPTEKVAKVLLKKMFSKSVSQSNRN